MGYISQLSIGKFSVMTHLTQKSLRLYDKKRLLIPNEKDPITGYRYYTMDQVSVAIKIRVLISLGFSLKEISKILEAKNSGNIHIINENISKKLSETQAKIQRLKQIEQILCNNQKELDIFYTQTSKPEIKEVPKIRAIRVQTKGSFKDVPKLINMLFSEILKPQNQENFVKITDPVMFINHNIDYNPDNSEFEVAVPISGRISISSKSIELINIPKATVISVLYTGKYDDLHQAYLRAHEYVQNNHYEIVGPTQELYLNDPADTPEMELLTKFQILVKNRTDG